MRGAMQIARTIADRGLLIAVVGIPKTIDNDIPYIDQSFGFQTAMAEATKSIHAASVEARSAPGGIGLVKLMGRHSGLDRKSTRLNSSHANISYAVFCLKKNHLPSEGAVRKAAHPVGRRGARGARCGWTGPGGRERSGDLAGPRVLP